MHAAVRLAGLAAFLAAAVGLVLPARSQPEQGRPAVTDAAPRAGVQWFTDLKQGLQEAKRTGWPILFVASAPSCGGIPGNW
ncbi:MAG: hypothetical protein FJX77_00570 [Armatimonadetes bacterium]|nr:hypothetical protein [Armatimonadota bacterium]